MINIPMGDMCLVCVNLHYKCNHLPFDTFRPMGKVDGEGYRQVRCEGFKKEEKEHE